MFININPKFSQIKSYDVLLCFKQLIKTIPCIHSLHKSQNESNINHAEWGDELSEKWDEEISIDGVSTDEVSANGICICYGIMGCEGMVGEIELKDFVSGKMKELFSMIGVGEDEWSIWEA